MESETGRLSIKIAADASPLEVAFKRIERSTDNLSRKLDKGFGFLDARIANFKTELAKLEGQIEKTGTLFTDFLETLGGNILLSPLALLGKQIKKRTAEANKFEAEVERLSDLSLQGLVKEFQDLESGINALKSADQEDLPGVDIGPDIESNRARQSLIVNNVKERISDLEDRIDSEIAPNGQVMSLKSMEDMLSVLEKIRKALEQIKESTDDLGLKNIIDGNQKSLNLLQRQGGGFEPRSPREVQLASSETGIGRATDRLAESAGRVDRVLTQQADSVRNLDSAARDLGFTLASSFEDAVVEGRNLSDVLRGLEQDILRILTRKLVTEPLAGAATGLVGSGVGALAREFHGSDPTDVSRSVRAWIKELLRSRPHARATLFGLYS